LFFDFVLSPPSAQSAVACGFFEPFPIRVDPRKSAAAFGFLDQSRIIRLKVALIPKEAL